MFIFLTTIIGDETLIDLRRILVGTEKYGEQGEGRRKEDTIISTFFAMLIEINR